MAGNFQDDDREQAMRELFDLYKDENEGRGGVDAHLDLDGRTIPFELKTTSKGSVTTVRDFGPDHIEKWRDKHWLIGFFVNGEEFYHYASPDMMAEWITNKASYIAPDFTIADLVARNLSLEDMHQVMEDKAVYTYEDAKSLQKMQYTKEEYLARQDLENGYSPERMLEIFRERGKYLVQRGSTLNNPHIPFTYFENWDKITENHAEVLRQKVREYFSEE
ncbi:TPA: hypothetical protein RI762_003551 [Vibrio cholerae]|nr:hypothetical protein [Vibrio cholerae]EGQ7787824.1 hypothetical protein [Vibrio cholerae]EKF9208416.1 hypothetical protein [Vibrio cholerae]EKF9266559.1 hypothetical protein [Vibrio cholerae]EKO4195295.1 hypothetical protein [Vibrio cholerae]MDV2304830.1 hypothetical protein [Vibrio cholerae]